MKRTVAAFGAIALAMGFLLLLSSSELESLAEASPPFSTPEPSHAQPELSVVPDASAYQLLVNPGVEVYDPRYRQYQGVNCQVASGWQRFWDGNLPEPYWMDCRVFAKSDIDGPGEWVERIEGETSQLVLSTERYTAGIMQRVTGLTPGVGYGFHAAMLTIYQSSAAPAVDGTMLKQVGMDPTGGTDPDAPAVIWCAPDARDKKGWSVGLRTAAFAESPEMTVFVRVISSYPAGADPNYLNISFLDSAILAKTPVVAATSPAVSDVPTFLVNWDNAVAAPGATELKWRDVQWLDEAEGVWHDWITHTYEVKASFAGEQGHAYRFRARVWQKYENGAHLYGPYRPEGDTRTVVVGSKLTGRVMTSEGTPLAGATVAISGTDHSTTSGAGGWYELVGPSYPDPQTVTVSHPNWPSPPPVYGVNLGPSATASITWTLLPRDDAIVNGQFEEEALPGWTVLEGTAVRTEVGEPVHTGEHALALGQPGTVGGTASLSQTVVLTGAWEPGLSFWYYPPETDPDDEVLTVQVSVVTQSITSTMPVTSVASVAGTIPVTTTSIYTPSLEVAGWHHQWYPVGPLESYLTATVTVQFELLGVAEDDPAPVYLDEVSLGSTAGGPEKVYLPLILR